MLCKSLIFILSGLIFFPCGGFLKKIENIFSVFLLSYRNTCESLGEQEKAVETLAY